jgi:hypothetical protein
VIAYVERKFFDDEQNCCTGNVRIVLTSEIVSKQRRGKFFIEIAYSGL